MSKYITYTGYNFNTIKQFVKPNLVIEDRSKTFISLYLDNIIIQVWVDEKIELSNGSFKLAL